MGYLYDINSASNYVLEYDNNNILITEYNTSTTIADGDTYHLIGKQDTLENLANKYYQDSNKWYIIALKNGIIDPFNLEVGKQLIIPKV